VGGTRSAESVGGPISRGDGGYRPATGIVGPHARHGHRPGHFQCGDESFGDRRRPQLWFRHVHERLAWANFDRLSTGQIWKLPDEHQPKQSPAVHVHDAEQIFRAGIFAAPQAPVTWGAATLLTILKN